MALITYTDKVRINENPDVPAVNKCQAVDMNEIKNVVNGNYNELSVDYIVEQGVNGIWSYRKWNSGIAEIWFTQTQAHQFSSTTSWGSVYESPSVYYTYPTDFFITEPMNIIQKGGGSGGWLEIGSGANRARTPNIWVIYPVNKTSLTTAYISVYAIGKWK